MEEIYSNDPYFESEFNMYGGPSLYCKMCGAYVKHHLTTKHLEFHKALQDFARLMANASRIGPIF